jgi:hypothetical protein
MYVLSSFTQLYGPIGSLGFVDSEFRVGTSFDERPLNDFLCIMESSLL